MTSFSFPPIGLPVCVLVAAFVGHPEEVSAQRGPQQKVRSLGAAIAEAERSPFHARNGVSGSVAPGSEPTAHFLWTGAESLVADQETGEGIFIHAPSTGKVFLATAAGALAANGAGLWLALSGALATDASASAYAAIAGGAAIAVLGPPVGATLVGGHFGGALAGSAVGTALGLITMKLIDWDASFALSLSLYSLLHAGATTFFEQDAWKALTSTR